MKTCHHAGDLDDPDFNNVHIEITPPTRQGCWCSAGDLGTGRAKTQVFPHRSAASVVLESVRKTLTSPGRARHS